VEDSTLADVRDAARVRRGRLGRRLGLALLTLFVAAGLLGVFGVRTGTASASGEGYELTVEYPRIARGGLDTEWRVTVRHPGGFSGPITLTTTAGYFDLFEAQGFYPSPSEETVDGDRYVTTFTEPPGDTFVLSFDAYIQPASQRGRSATTSLVVGGRDVAAVTYRTRLVP
jgi:hypothetical protein